MASNNFPPMDGALGEGRQSLKMLTHPEGVGHGGKPQERDQSKW